MIRSPASMTLSRFVAAIELIFILLPLALVTLWGAILVLPIGLAIAVENPRGFSVFLLGVLCGVSFIALLLGSPLVVRFVGSGRPALINAPRREWLAAIVGACAALTGAGLAVVDQGPAFAIGLPALVPFLHVYCERRLVIADRSTSLHPPSRQHAEVE